MSAIFSTRAVQLVTLASFSIIILLNTAMLLPGKDELLHQHVSDPCVSSCLNRLKPSELPNTNQTQSLCSVQTTTRGDHQKVVAASFYGDLITRNYFRGIEENLDLMQVLYPGWLFRLYFDPGPQNIKTRRTLCSLSCYSSIFDLCPVTHLPYYGDLSAVFGMTWRFLPMADSTVDIMVSRDLDSRFTPREANAVSDWLASDHPFHIMRDHPGHAVPILGGMWGARLDTGKREKYGEIIANLMKNAARLRWARNMDQEMLEKWVWPQVKDEAVVHDSYYCKRYKNKYLRAWPSEREDVPGNFVGAPNGQISNKTCPTECRPVNHKDWTMC